VDGAAPGYVAPTRRSTTWSSHALHLPPTLRELVGNVLTVVTTMFLAWGVTRGVDALRKVLIDPRVAASASKLDDQLVPMADKAVKAVIWSMALLIAFSNLGYDILSLLTGLGIGGLAVAMAAQATLHLERS
jgi:small-conductance mechanosensitive channel